MGKRLRHLIAGALLFAGLCISGMISAAEGDFSLEQVYVNLPEVTVYSSGVETDNPEAYLGERKLQVTGCTPFAATGQPAYYYVLLDVSNSMPEEYFDDIKDSILAFEKTLGAQDRLVLYTFGEEVMLRLDENHSQADTQAVLAGIDNTDNKTLLFEAIRQAADRAGKVLPSVCKRRILVVISDGEDFTVGKTGAQEAQENLKRTGIPAYAFGIADTARENLNHFGEFARTSGGQLTIFGQEQASTVLDGFHSALGAYDVMEFTAEDNTVSNSMQTFTLKTSANQTVTKDVLVARHIPDQTAPVILRVENVADDQIEVEFSEPVRGADVSSNYSITRKDLKKDKKEKEGGGEEADSEMESGGEDGKKEITAVASVSRQTPTVMLLTFTGELKPGEYQVACTNIVDLSMEKNEVVNTLGFEVGKPPFMTRILNGIREWYWIFLIVIAAALIVAIGLVYRKVKKGRGVLYVDGKPVMAADVEVHKHVAIQEETGKPFEVRVSVKGNKPEDMCLHLTDSFIVGRSQICNLYLDDKRMSRQHFALEWDGQDMYVTDLDTTNGTLVNGVKINQRRRLQLNDKISAGSVEMTIRW